MKILSLDYVLHITGFQEAPTAKGKVSNGANASRLRRLSYFQMLNNALTAWGLQLQELFRATSLMLSEAKSYGIFRSEIRPECFKLKI